MEASLYLNALHYLSFSIMPCLISSIFSLSSLFSPCNLLILWLSLLDLFLRTSNCDSSLTYCFFLSSSLFCISFFSFLFSFTWETFWKLASCSSFWTRSCNFLFSSFRCSFSWIILGRLGPATSINPFYCCLMVFFKLFIYFRNYYLSFFISKIWFWSSSTFSSLKNAYFFRKTMT